MRFKLLTLAPFLLFLLIFHLEAPAQSYYYQEEEITRAGDIKGPDFVGAPDNSEEPCGCPISITMDPELVQVITPCPETCDSDEYDCNYYYAGYVFTAQCQPPGETGYVY